MIGLAYREELPDPVQRELDHLIGQLKGFLSTSFNEDGTLIVGAQQFNLVPTGSILPYCGTTAPDGWVLCDGAQVNRVDYKALFDVIGTTYGVGDGSTTFNLPDLRQRFPLGKAAAGTGVTLGSTGGAIDHTHTSAAHTHTFTSGTASQGTFVSSAAPNDQNMAPQGHTHSGTTDSTTPGATGTNNPPYQVVNYIILANRRTV